MTNNHSDQPGTDQAPFFEGDLPPGELERILNRIEENMAFRSILKQQSPFLGQNDLPPVVSFDSLKSRLEEINALNAPYFRPELSRGPGVFVRRVLNRILKIFGYKQKQFNADLLALLHDMTVMFQQALLEQHQALTAARREIQQLQAARQATDRD